MDKLSQNCLKVFLVLSYSSISDDTLIPKSSDSQTLGILLTSLVVEAAVLSEASVLMPKAPFGFLIHV